MSDSDEKCIVIETKYGPVDLPVDEHWAEYSEAERSEIRALLEAMMGDESEDVRNFCLESGYNARNLAPLRSLEEARKASDGILVMEGDWGGQIYLTCPVRLVKCDRAVLIDLLKKVDDTEWGCNEGDGGGFYFQRGKAGDGVSGGMGGGLVEEGLWIHPSISPETAALIRRVISGESGVID